MDFFVPCNWHFRHKNIPQPHPHQQVVVVAVACCPSLWNTFQSNFDDVGWVNENGYLILLLKTKKKTLIILSKVEYFSFHRKLTYLLDHIHDSQTLPLDWISFLCWRFSPNKACQQEETSNILRDQSRNKVLHKPPGFPQLSHHFFPFHQCWCCCPSR